MIYIDYAISIDSSSYDRLTNKSGKKTNGLLKCWGFIPNFLAT